MIYFLLIAILIMCGWIMITLNEIDRTNTEHCMNLSRQINNMKMQQDGIHYKVDGLYEYLVIAEDKREIEEHRKIVEERNKDIEDNITWVRKIFIH